MIEADHRSSPLLTDLYQLNMLQAYLERGLTAIAVFEFFVRKLPPRRAFLIAAGLEQALQFLEQLRFSDEELDWLKQSGRFKSNLLDYAATLRFEGDVHAMPEGAIFFANEPILRISAPLPLAQLVETRLINLLHFETLIASKAARFALAAPGRQLIDFGLRRAHGAEAGLLAARASYIAGFAGTATTLAGVQFGIPIHGTMAHSFIQAHDDETEAFVDFSRSRPDNLVLLIDTYDTEAAAAKVVVLAPRLAREGITIHGVRLDSGDLADLAVKVRRILDVGGLSDVKIFASSGLDEDQLRRMVESGAPIDGFGIGTNLTTSADAPAFDCAYKLQEYAGIARRKRSTGKATWPGRKQVWRRFDDDGRFAGDTLGLDDDQEPTGTPLIAQVMRRGRRLAPAEGLQRIRDRVADGLAHLPARLRHVDADGGYDVAITPSLQQLADEVDRRQQGHPVSRPGRIAARL
jgi:nicotinate phosphoribosyltransferase